MNDLIDQDPSSEDIERFSGQTAYCPECGGEVWDQAEFCPSCGAQVGGETLSRPPTEHWLRSRWMILVALAALAAFVLVYVL